MELRATYFVEDQSNVGHLVIYVEGGSEPTQAFMQRNYQYLKRKLIGATVAHQAVVNRRIHSRLAIETRQRPTVVSIPTPDKQARTACIQFIEAHGGQFLAWVNPERRISV